MAQTETIVASGISNLAQPQAVIAAVEAQFITAGITADTTKFAHAVQALPTEVLEEVSTIILTPPTSEKYKTLREAVLKAFLDSEQRKINRLLTETPTCDQRPSRLLRKMRDLAGANLTDNVIRQLWTRQLPPVMQAVLVAAKADLGELADMANSIADMGAHEGPHHVTQVAASSPAATSSSDERMDRLEKAINSIAKSVKGSRGPAPASSSSAPDKKGNRANMASSDRPTTPTKQCWYHRRFCESARKCVTPCSFKPSDEKPGNA